MRTSRSHSRASPKLGGGNTLIHNLDRPIVLALTVLAVVYSVITVVTYWEVSSTNYDEAATTVMPLERNHRQQIDVLQHMFPIHVGNDVETVVHPGLELAKPEKIPSSVARTMMVPKFFDSSHGLYYFEDANGNLPNDASTKNYTIRSYLGDGQSVLSPELAASIGSWTTIDNELMETIYCSIASYRDPECTASVEDLYARAQYPQRIRVAILDQLVNGDPVCSQPAVPCTQDPEQALCKYAHLIDVFEMDAVLAVGPVFARHLAHRHYRGEYYAMQIDSHVRFVEHWDSDIIAQWKSAHNEMAVLSTYLSDLIGSIDPVTHKGMERPST
jgi:Glycosyltransferase (GlcNAc)